MTKIITNKRYCAISGTAIDVSGVFFAIREKNTVSPSKIDIDTVIFSPVKQNIIN